jgi:uncharacterized lipoprotein NlpE involved in copper resistance
MLINNSYKEEKMTKNTIFHLLAVLLFAAVICSCTPKNANDSNWAGLYSGTIPAADAPGINVKITLNPDFTFMLVYNYIDTEDGIFNWYGIISSDDNPIREGSIIDLEIANFPSLYRIGKDQLLQLDMEGNEITGDLAEMYVLKKD